MMGICYKCKKKVSPDFNVCPYCGVDLTLDDETIEIENVPEEGITIEFNYSSSQSFEFAVKSARKFTTFRQFGEDKKATYRVTVMQSELSSLNELLENLKGWRSRKVYVDGDKVQWDSVFNYVWCYNHRNKSYKPELYCFGYKNDYGISPWGCIQTRLFFNEFSDIFKYGKWLNSEGDWQFDKAEIKHHIERDFHEYRFCPAMNKDFIDSFIAAFPEVVNPNKDNNWKFDESYEEDDDCLKVEVMNYGEKETLFMKGVVPKKVKVILKEINEKLKIKLPIEILK